VYVYTIQSSGESEAVERQGVPRMEARRSTAWSPSGRSQRWGARGACLAARLLAV